MEEPHNGTSLLSYHTVAVYDNPGYLVLLAANRTVGHPDAGGIDCVVCDGLDFVGLSVDSNTGGDILPGPLSRRPESPLARNALVHAANHAAVDSFCLGIGMWRVSLCG